MVGAFGVVLRVRPRRHPHDRRGRTLRGGGVGLWPTSVADSTPEREKAPSALVSSRDLNVIARMLAAGTSQVKRWDRLNSTGEGGSLVARLFRCRGDHHLSTAWDSPIKQIP